MEGYTPKNFWDKPEGTTGKLFGAALVLGGGYLLYQSLPFLISLVSGTLTLVMLLVALAAIIFVLLDPKFRNLIFYMYKSFMRFITGIFIQIDPIGVLKSYIDDLKENLRKMDKQIGNLRGQMRKLKNIIIDNRKQIQSNIALANQAKKSEKKAIMILKSRKAGRLKESNLKLEDLYKKMEIMYRVLGKMQENSGIMLEDIQDQVMVKEQERNAIRASHSAMKSAMNIIAGKSDKREMFDQALEAINDDVGMKIGEMERFMDMSSNFMDSIDLQNGVFEEEGLRMLEKWEKEGVNLLLGEEKDLLVREGNSDSTEVDLDIPFKRGQRGENQYNDLFNF